MKRIAIAALAATLVLAAGAATAQQRLNEPQVRSALEAQGYTRLDDVKFDDGMWEAEGTRPDGRRVDVRIDASTGEIYPEDGTTTLTDADIRASLEAAGYSRIHDVKFDDGLWEAEGYDGNGVEYELYLDPRTAAIVGRERD